MKPFVVLYAAREGHTQCLTEQLAKRASTATDTSRDYELTDWKAAHYLVAVIAEPLGRTATTAHAAHA